MADDGYVDFLGIPDMHQDCIEDQFSEEFVISYMDTCLKHYFSQLSPYRNKLLGVRELQQFLQQAA